MTSDAGLSLRARARDAIERDKDRLIGLARDVHAHPQIAFAEEYAAGRIGEYLGALGFEVQPGVHGMPTAFIGSYGQGPLHVVFCAEYDALPPTGLSDRVPKEFEGLVPVDTEAPVSDVHACGHNVITGAAVAAVTGLRDLVDELGLRVSVFGTPGEELIGLPNLPPGRQAPGKTVFVRAGAFDDVHAALMVHPFPTPYGAFIPTSAYGRRLAELSTSGDVAGPVEPTQVQALQGELTAAVTDLGQSLLWCRVEPDGAEAPVQVDVFWLAASQPDVSAVGEAVERRLHAFASANDLTLVFSDIAPSVQMRNDPALAAAYRRNARTLGREREHDPQVHDEVAALRKLSMRGALRHPGSLPGLLKSALHPPVGLFFDTFPAEVLFGTDMGDVSQVVPAIHPFVGIGGFAAPHSIGFTAQADSDQAYRAMVDAGVALAWTAIDAAIEPALKAHLLAKEAS